MSDEKSTKSVWQKCMDVLKENKVEAYPPATKEGECLREYVVLKQDGGSQYQTFSSEVQYYTFLLYVPRTKYASLAFFKEKVKEVIATDLYPLLMPTGLETPDFYDDSVKAYMVSIQYRNNVHNKHL